MNDERTILEIFANDTVLFNAVQSILKSKILARREEVIQKAMFTDTYSNESIGAQMRACAEGIRLVEAVFRDLTRYQKTPIQPEYEKNPGR